MVDELVMNWIQEGLAEVYIQRIITESIQQVETEQFAAQFVNNIIKTAATKTTST
jgi:hypothetical protein